MTGVLTDLRSAMRQFTRNRGLTFLALTSLAVGIGVSVAITTIAHAVLIRPLPYERPQELVMIWRQGSGPNPLTAFWGRWKIDRNLATPGMVQGWRDQPLPFADLAVVESWQTSWSTRVDLIAGASVERLRGTLATPNLFQVLGVRASVGRTFGDDETGVAVISDALWRRRFGGDPSVLGTALTLAAGRDREQSRVEIIGVLPERFRFDYPDETEIWLPLAWSAVAREFPMALSYRAVARLRRDTPLRAAEAAMQAIHDPADRARGTRIWLEPMHDWAVGASQGAVLLVSALALMVLLGGAVNAATAFAASTVSRLNEMRVRRALGASSSRIARQVFIEVLALAALAGAMGVAALALTLPGLRALLPPGTPRTDEIRLDIVALIAVWVAVAGSTLLAGSIPAWLGARDRGHHHLDGTHTTTVSRAGLRLRAGLLGAQFVLVAMLLMVGLILLRSFWHIVTVNRGFDAPANVFAAELRLMHPAYRDRDLEPFERELVARVRALPYVDAAAMTSAVPLIGTDRVNRLTRPDGQRMYVNVRSVDPAYFDVMQIPLISGRWLSDADDNDRDWVALVSQSLAEALYPGENPLGRFLEGSSGARIVGVVADVRARSLMERPTPALYWPRALQTSNPAWLVVRSTMGGAQVIADLTRVIRDVYPDETPARVTTLRQILDDSVADRRAYAVVSTAFALVMVLLAGMGLSGHLTHVIAERARDLAIRTALGASSRQQVLDLSRHLVPGLVGGVGVAVAGVYLAYPIFEPVTYQINRFDAMSCAVAVSLVVSFALTSVIYSSRRLSRLDTATVLRAV